MSDDSSKRIREQFEIFKERTFMNWASLSPAPLSAVTAVKSMVEEAASFRNGDLNASWIALSDKLRDEAARLLNSGRERIAVAGSSTTQGIQMAFDAIRPSKGDNIVTTDLEFPSMGAELQKWKPLGVEVRTVKSSRGSYTPADVDALVDNKTKAVVVSSVTWTNGFMPDLRAVADAAHGAGAYLVVDAVQHMGAMKFDVQKTEPDFASAGGQKWMTSPFGTALLYVSRRASEELEPPHYTISGMSEPEGGWNDYFAKEQKNPLDEITVVREGRSMEYGGWNNHVGMVGLKESLKLINSVGSENVESRIRRLSGQLRQRLDEMGADVISPLEHEHSSSITTFRLNESYKEHISVVEKLSRRGIVVSCRGISGLGGIRVSMHHMNNEEDIDRLMQALTDVKSGGA